MKPRILGRAQGASTRRSIIRLCFYFQKHTDNRQKLRGRLLLTLVILFSFSSIHSQYNSTSGLIDTTVAGTLNIDSGASLHFTIAANKTSGNIQIINRKLSKFTISISSGRKKIFLFSQPDLLDSNFQLTTFKFDYGRKQKRVYVDTVILNTGTYYLKIPKELFRKAKFRKRLKVSLKVLQASFYDQIPEVSLLNDWLTKGEFKNIFELVGYTNQASNINFITRRARAKFTEQSGYIGEFRARGSKTEDVGKLVKSLSDIEEEEKYKFNKHSVDSILTVTDYGIIRAPYLFVNLKLNPGISSFQKIHNDYLLATKEDISEVLFNKIMFYSGVDPENILLHVGCSNQFEYTSIFKGNNEPKLQWLQVGGCSEPWSVISEELLSKNSKIFNAQPGQKTEIGELNKDIGREAEIFLNTIYFKESKFKPLLDFKRQDKYQFDVIIRGMKGLIIHGGDKWEKIRLRLKVREGVDGKYLSLETSALYAPRSKSDYPADNYFEKDYELTGDEGKVKEFGDALLTAFLKHLNK